MTPEDYERAWQDLPGPTSDTEMEASEVSVGHGVWVARDRADRRHLLVRVPDAGPLQATGTRGLDVSVRAHRIAGRTDAYIDLVCVDPAASTTFSVAVADIADDVLTVEPGLRRDRVMLALTKWRWFWGVDPTHLSAQEAVGLFGELWFLVRWATVTPASVSAWEGSNSSRHDFQWPSASVEVKATSRAGPPVHHIQNLDQLADPGSGQLFLFSLRLARDNLAANTLDGLVRAATETLDNDPPTRDELLGKLHQRGYSPAAREHTGARYRVVEEALYRISEGFPRLTEGSFAGGLPAGVTTVSYLLDMNACTKWKTSTTSTDWLL